MLTHPKSTVRAILNNFRVWLRISPEWIKTSTTENKLDQPPSLLRLTKKIGELWPSNKKVISADVDLPQVDNTHSAYTNAFEFGSRDFATEWISAHKLFPQLDLRRRAALHRPYF